MQHIVGFLVLISWKVPEEVVEDGTSMLTGNWAWVSLCVVIAMTVAHYPVNHVFISWVVSDWSSN